MPGGMQSASHCCIRQLESPSHHTVVLSCRHLWRAELLGLCLMPGSGLAALRGSRSDDRCQRTRRRAGRKHARGCRDLTWIGCPILPSYRRRFRLAGALADSSGICGVGRRRSRNRGVFLSNHSSVMGLQNVGQACGVVSSRHVATVARYEASASENLVGERVQSWRSKATPAARDFVGRSARERKPVYGGRDSRYSKRREDS